MDVVTYVENFLRSKTVRPSWQTVFKQRKFVYYVAVFINNNINSNNNNNTNNNNNDNTRVFQKTSTFYLFIHQHAMQAEHDIVVPIPSTSPSVCLVPVLCVNDWRYCCNFFGHSSTRIIILFFCVPPQLQNLKEPAHPGR